MRMRMIWLKHGLKNKGAWEMIEGGKKLEEYLSQLEMTSDSKRKYKKAITEFLALLTERGKNTPDESDYSNFQSWLQEHGNTEATAKDRVKKARKFFTWLDDNDYAGFCGFVEASGVEGLEEEKRRKDKARFSLMLSPSLRENLEMLAQFRRCSVTEILIGLAEKCVTENAGDIESMRDFYRKHSARGD